MLIVMKTILSYTYRSLQSSYFLWKLKNEDRTAIVIIGCGRSGTTFTSRWFKNINIKIGHERFLRDCISSWYLTSEQNKVPLGPSFGDLLKIDKVVIHQVREPLKAISSMLSTGSLSWHFLAKEIPVNPSNDAKVLMAMKYYYYWNRLSEKKAQFRVRAEYFEHDIARVLNVLDYRNIPINNLTETSRVNTRSYKSLSFHDLVLEDAQLANNIIKMGQGYGY